MRAQRQLIDRGAQVLVVFEGRDASGKDGTIKRIVEHLNPRASRIVALGKPSDRDRQSWYFQRYVAHLPAAGEIVLFNRSRYNRAGVERVMGFCTDEEYDLFLRTVPLFEQLLVHCGMTLIKYYLDISKAEQRRRLAARRSSVIHQWKNSPLDALATKHWKQYSQARNEMFARTHSTVAPWTIIRTDDKRSARVNLMRDLLLRLAPGLDADRHQLPDPAVVFSFNTAHLEDGTIAP